MTNLTLNANNFAGGWDNKNDLYPEFLQSIKDTFNSRIGKGIPLFKTGVENLFDVFLNNLPEVARQHYNCHECRRFVNRYGSLVVLTPEGKIESALWNEAPGIFNTAIKAMRVAVLKGEVTNVFITEHITLGTPVTGEWEHMSVQIPRYMLYHRTTKTAGEKMAEKREDFKSLMNGIEEFSLNNVREAVNLLRSGELVRSEKHTAAAEWLKLIHERRSNTKNKRELDNIVWYAVATAPEGWCHIKSGMLGNLLEDIKDGLSLETIKRNRAKKMEGDVYQRPQADPTEANKKDAEKIVTVLGLEPSLERRYARLDEIKKIWEPAVAAPIKKGTTGVFDHVKTKDAKQELNDAKYAPKVKMTWKKFAEEVLPKAKGIQYYVPVVNRNYTAIVTAVHPDAPPIIQWDKEEQRNPFSWYLYKNGTPYTNWNISSNGYHKVSAICFQPSMWYEENSHQGKGVIFILDGAKDLSHSRVGAVLFPEILKSELHPVRATIEAYSRGATMEGFEESSACGIILHSGVEWNETFLVTTDDGMAIYVLDRWD